MGNLHKQIETYLEIYDPLGMGELASTEELYRPVVPEIIQKLSNLSSAEEAAEAVHRVLYLTYGNQAGHVRNYADLGRDLLKLVRQTS